MHDFFSGKIKEFWSGSIIGFIAGIKLLFNGPVTWGDYVLVYTVKFFAVILFSLASGVMTVVAKDVYSEYIGPKLFKKKYGKDNNGATSKD